MTDNAFAATIYGRTSGRNSPRTVSDGWVDAFAALHRSGLTEFSARSVGGPADMAGAMDWQQSAAIVTDLHLLETATALPHDRFAVVVAPHTASLPLGIATTLLQVHALLLPPSQFCARLLSEALPSLETCVVPHGVHEAYRPLSKTELSTPNWLESRRRLRGPGLNFVHLAAGDISRKGTDKLIEVFASMLDRGLDATLTCVLSGLDLSKMTLLARSCDPEKGNRIRIVPRLDAPAHQMRWFYPIFDVIIQPSRVEGFGLCPLEALCCGVPAVVTTGSGHDEWLGLHRNPSRTGGVATMPISETLAPMPSEPVPCPTVDAQVLEQTIWRVAASFDGLREEASSLAAWRGKFFAWELVVNVPRVRAFLKSPDSDGRTHDSSRGA